MEYWRLDLQDRLDYWPYKTVLTRVGVLDNQSRKMAESSESTKGKLVVIGIDGSDNSLFAIECKLSQHIMFYFYIFIVFFSY